MFKLDERQSHPHPYCSSQTCQQQDSRKSWRFEQLSKKQKEATEAALIVLESGGYHTASNMQRGLLRGAASAEHSHCAPRHLWGAQQVRR